MTVSVVNREQIEHRNDPSLLPLLTEYIPGTFHDFQRADGIWGIRRGCGGNELYGDWGLHSRGLPTTGCWC